MLRSPCMLAIEVSVSEDAIGCVRRDAAEYLAGVLDTLTSVARLCCCTMLVFLCWTGKVAFNMHPGD